MKIKYLIPILLTVLVLALFLGLALACTGAEPELTAEDVVNAFKTAGIQIVDVEIYTEESDPNDLLGRPGQYIGKANWSDARAEQFGEDLKGGTVEVFDSEESLIKRKEYLEPFLEEAMFLQYVYIHKNVIVRIDGDLTPTQAKEYEQILNSL